MEKSPKAKERLLISVRNDIQAALVENLLKDENINCVKKHKSLGAVASIYTGMSNFGIDIFVNESDFKKATETIKIYDGNITDESLEQQALSYKEPKRQITEDDNKAEDVKKEKFKYTKQIIIAAVIALLILAVKLLT